MFAIRLARIPRSRANPHEARGAGLRQAPANRSLEERQRILDEDGVAEGEELHSNILSQDFALVRSSSQKFTKPPSVVPIRYSLLASAMLAFEELKISDCRWPVAESDHGEILFCGEAAVSGCPYCAAHEAIAYRPVTAEFRARRLRGHHPRCP
jgi:hypothetical protein